MSTRLAATLPLVVTALVSACRPPAAVVTLTDPDGLAADAATLQIGDEDERVAQPLGAETFPVQVTLTADREGTRAIFVDAVDADGVTAARASGDVSFSREGVSEVELRLGRACSGDDAPEGELDPRCDDGVFCNGFERCVAGVCRSAPPACPASAVACVEVSCVEAARACAVETRNDVCDEGRYCDARSGCVPGVPCDTDSECDDGSVCSGEEVCELGRCRDGPPLNYDDENPCTLDACTDDDDRGEIHVPLADGTPCAQVPEGVCIAGTCVPSRCGDGVRDDQRGEECDDGNDDSSDECVPGCLLATCGDGFAHATLEACDDGNTEDGDGCRGDCQKVEVCGDGALDAGEECDDGPAGAGNPNDGCDACRRFGWTTTPRTGSAAPGADPRAVSLGTPLGLALHPDGRAFVTGDDTPFIWMLDERDGVRVATPFAGNSSFGGPSLLDLDEADRRAVETRLNFPGLAAVTPGGVVYVVEREINQPYVRAFYPDGTSRIVAGTGAAPAQGGGQNALAAYFNSVRCLSSTADESVLVCTPSAVYRLRTDGRLYTELDGLVDVRSAIPDDQGGLFVGLGTDFQVRRFNENGVRVADYGDGRSSCALPVGEVGPQEVCIARPTALALSGDTLYVVDTPGHVIFAFRLSLGKATAFLGGDAAGYTEDGPLTSQLIDSPVAVAAAADGAVWFVEGGAAGLVRRVTSDRELETLFGTRDPTPRTLVGPPLGAALSRPRELVERSDGRLVVWDRATFRLYELSADGERLSLLAGDGSEDTFLGDTALSQPLPDVVALAELPSGAIAVADRTQGRVLSISLDGDVTLLLGLDDDGNGEPAEPFDLSREAGGTLLVSDGNDSSPRLLRLSEDGSFETVLTALNAGSVASCPSTGAFVWRRDGAITMFAADGTSRSTLSNVFPRDLLCEGAPEAVLMVNGGRIQRWTQSSPDVWSPGFWIGTPSTSMISPPGLGRLTTTLGGPWAVAATAEQDAWWVADAVRVWRAPQNGPMTVPIAPAHLDGALDEAWVGSVRALSALPPSVFGEVGTFGGTTFALASGLPGYGRLVHLDGDAGAVQTVVGFPAGATAETSLFGDTPPARFLAPLGEAAGVAYDPLSSPPRLFFSDRDRHAIYVVELHDPARPSTWTQHLFAGAPNEVGYSDDGLSARQSLFDNPHGLAVDAPRRALYVAEDGNHVVRRIDLGSELVSTIAGVPGVAGDAVDGTTALAATMRAPTALAVTAHGHVYVADTGNHRVRLILREDGAFGETVVVLGDGQAASGGDGAPARDVLVDTPLGLAVDSFGNLFVTSRLTVRVVTAGGDRLADGDDDVRTVYGAAPRVSYPERFTSCLAGIALAPDDDRVVFGDRCRGLLLEARRTRVTAAP